MKIKDDIFLQKLNQFSEKNEVDMTKCPVCGNNSLVWSTVLFEIREYHKGNLVIGKGSSILPVVTATCSKCGHVVLFNAITLGLVDPITGEVVGSEENESETD